MPFAVRSTKFGRRRRTGTSLPRGSRSTLCWRERRLAATSSNRGSVVLAGPVNVGKSSLINALVGYGRSIVHDAPGTTRDAVTATTAIDGWPVELCDTAGLRAASSLGPVEAAGIQLAHERLAEAELAVLVFDQSASWSNEDESLPRLWPRALVVHNKADLPPAPGTRPAGTTVSALHGQGLGELLALISTRLVPNPPTPGMAVPLDNQQLEAIRRLARAVGQASSLSRR